MLENLEQVSIAAINGYAIGGGWALRCGSTPPAGGVIAVHSTQAETRDGLNAGITSSAKQVSCSLNWLADKPMGKPSMMCSSPG